MQHTLIHYPVSRFFYYKKNKFISFSFLSLFHPINFTSTLFSLSFRLFPGFYLSYFFLFQFIHLRGDIFVSSSSFFFILYFLYFFAYIFTYCISIVCNVSSFHHQHHVFFLLSFFFYFVRARAARFFLVLPPRCVQYVVSQSKQNDKKTHIYTVTK